MKFYITMFCQNSQYVSRIINQSMQMLRKEKLSLKIKQQAFYLLYAWLQKLDSVGSMERGRGIANIGSYLEGVSLNFW